MTGRENENVKNYKRESNKKIILYTSALALEGEIRRKINLSVRPELPLKKSQHSD